MQRRKIKNKKKQKNEIKKTHQIATKSVVPTTKPYQILWSLDRVHRNSVRGLINTGEANFTKPEENKNTTNQQPWRGSPPFARGPGPGARR